VKLPAHRAGLPGKVISFCVLCPLTPPRRRGLQGMFRQKNSFFSTAYRQALGKGEMIWEYMKKEVECKAKRSQHTKKG
jgi:hypothetical protein